MKLCDFRKLLIMGVLLLALTLALQAGSPKGPFVRDVALSTSGESLEARITASETAKFSYFRLDNPPRLVVDFHGLENGISFSQKTVGTAGVLRVRTGYYTDADRTATRIVFDLDGPAKYRVVDEGNGVVRVLFGAAQSPEPTRVAAESVPATLLAGPPVIAEPAAEAKVELARIRLASLSTVTEVAGLEPVAAPRAGILQAAQATSQTGTELTRLSAQISTAPEATTPVVSEPAEPQTFNGEIIDLNLRQADIADFFRLIGDISGLNVVVDPNVSGTVTVLLRDVPWDQALDIVLRNYNLGAILQGNVLRVATKATLQNEETQRRAAREALANSVPLISRTYVLNYAKANDVASTLTASGVLSQRGKVATEVRRNAIIVTDSPDQFDSIEKMKAFIDVPAQQVEIEARLLQGSKSFSRDIGSQLGLLVGANSGNVFTGGSGAGSPFSRTPPPRVTAGNSSSSTSGNGLPLLTNLPAAATSGAAFLMQPGSDILLDAIITAAEANGTARLLSQPKVTTQNNMKAEISQGTQIPVQTNVNNTVTTTFLNFALKLDVTPQVTEDGTILMDIDIENSQPDFARAVNGIPSVSTQRATTQTWVPDGSTMMIGGIFLDTDSLNIRQVPGLGSIPIIGHLFKNTQTVKSQAELFFFITPRIRKTDAVTATAPAN